MYQNERAPRSVRTREAQRRLHKDGRILPHDRAHASLVRSIRFAEGDPTVIRAALVAVADIQVLLDHAPLSDIAADAATARLAIIRAALVRFLPWSER
jgi:hypothetical protein